MYVKFGFAHPTCYPANTAKSFAFSVTKYVHTTFYIVT